VAGEQFTESLQENLVTVLAYNIEQGRLLSRTLNTGLMDPNFRTIADACIEYWKQYDKPPMDHTADLLAHIIEDTGHRQAKAITRILRGMVQLSPSLNTEYILRQKNDHERMQQIKALIIESAEKINTMQHLAIRDIEDEWNRLLANRETINFDPGLRLTNYRAVMDQVRKTDAEFKSGIAMLDNNHIIPARGEVFIWLGASGRGKTWALIQQGGEALKDRKKVLHLTHELDAYKTAIRYYQYLFRCAKRDLPAETTELDIRDGELVGLLPKKIQPAFSLENESLSSDELRTHIKMFGRRFNNLIIKSFPSGEMDNNTMLAYLDMLEAQTGFVPDIVIDDYLGIHRVDRKDPRASHRQNMIDFRGTMQKRNMAGVTAWQSNREGADAKMIKATHVAEAWPIVENADNIVAFSSTDREFNLGLCRGFVPKGRGERDKFGFLMTQSYAIGQFCMDSHWLKNSYFDALEELPDAERESDG
jgi:hypothetical protein